MVAFRDFRDSDNLPRGIRNNNPGNIKCFDNWQGSIGVDDRGFCIFSNMFYGVRALLKLLHTYYFKYELTTLVAIFERYAPEEDNNDPNVYAMVVGDEMGIGIHNEFSWDLENVVSLVRGIVKVENGRDLGSIVTAGMVEEVWLRLQNKEHFPIAGPIV